MSEVERAPRARTIDADAIRDAALSLFAEHGYWGTTMADIGNALGIRGPSLYRHVESKQQLLVEIMFGTQRELLDLQERAIATGFDHREKLFRAVYQHVLHHCLHRREAFVSSRETRSLDESNRGEFERLRGSYMSALQNLIADGRHANDFNSSEDERLVTHAILDMGIGVAGWFSQESSLTAERVSMYYASIALRMVGAGPDSEMPHLYWGPSTFIPA